MKPAHRTTCSRRGFVLLAALLTTAHTQAQQAPSAPDAFTLLRSGQWTYAYTLRLPLDPLDSWNQFSAVVKEDAGALRLEVYAPYSGDLHKYALAPHSEGFTFDNPGIGEVLMKFDPNDAVAPFKGQVGNRTYWLLRRR